MHGLKQTESVTACCCVEEQPANATGQAATLKSRPTAMPSAADTEVELCPAPKGSYSLSSRFVKPAQ